MKFYAGIGSRTTPSYITEVMTNYANILEVKGYVLRSGGAEGADTAFEKGVMISKNKIILKSKHTTEKAIHLASTVHPAWDKCNEHVRKIHGRNAMLIMGQDIISPVEFVLCWTPNEEVGGTALGIRVAKKNNIPVYNFFYKDQIQYFHKILVSD